MGILSLKAETFWGTPGVDLGNFLLEPVGLVLCKEDISYAGASIPKNSHSSGTIRI
jgi:hypothetical protein